MWSASFDLLTDELNAHQQKRNHPSSQKQKGLGLPTTKPEEKPKKHKKCGSCVGSYEKKPASHLALTTPSPLGSQRDLK